MMMKVRLKSLNLQTNIYWISTSLVFLLVILFDTANVVAQSEVSGPCDQDEIIVCESCTSTSCTPGSSSSGTNATCGPDASFCVYQTYEFDKVVITSSKGCPEVDECITTGTISGNENLGGGLVRTWNCQAGFVENVDYFCEPDPCASQTPCENGGTCVNDGLGYVCDCVDGYTGTDCDVDIDDCACDPCLNGGSCLDSVAGYSCDCATGFTGPNCETDAQKYQMFQEYQKFQEYQMFQEYHMFQEYQKFHEYQMFQEYQN